MPSPTSWGRVVGRVVRSRAGAAATTAPDSIADAVAASGSARFTPVKLLAADGGPALVASAVSVVDLDPATGGLVDADGVPGVWLAPGDWRVDFHLSGASLDGYLLTVTEGHTATAPLDLADATPAAPPPATLSPRDALLLSRMIDGDRYARNSTIPMPRRR